MRAWWQVVALPIAQLTKGLDYPTSDKMLAYLQGGAALWSRIFSVRAFRLIAISGLPRCVFAHKLRLSQGVYAGDLRGVF